MKACTVIAVSAVVTMVAIDSVAAYAKYLDELPNGSLFEKTLGHKGDSGYTDFGTAFSKAGSWTADFCKAKYPGTDMTNGAAFGDPCCTWKKGGDADKTVNAWTDKPLTATECTSAAATTAPASSSAAPAPTPASTKTDSSASASSTPAPVTTTAAPSSSGSKAKPAPTPAASKNNLRKCKVKEDKSLDADEDEDDDDN